MICPRCDFTLSSRYLEGITLDKCSGCQGHLFDPDEFEPVVEGSSSSQPRTARDRLLIAIKVVRERGEQRQDKDLLCPRCGATMEKLDYKESGVIIDRCPEEGCGVIWLDGGEIEKCQAWAAHLKEEEEEGG